MKEITAYIIEKLKINKDTCKRDSKHYFDVGDPIFGVSLHLPESDKYLAGIYEYTFKDYSNNKLTIKTLTKPELISFPIEINSNDIFEQSYQAQSKKEFNHTNIYLNRYDIVKFIHEIIDTDIENKEKLYNYFDKEDEFIDDYEWHIPDITLRSAKDILRKYDRH